MTDVMLALANARDGRAEAFERWYEHEYAPALLGLDGILGRRLLRAADDLDDAPEHPYEFVSIFEIASGELASTADRLNLVQPPTSPDQEGETVSWFYEELGPRVAAPGAGDGPFHQMLVFTNANPGTDPEFNRWYDEVHIPDIFNTIGGFVGAHRYRRAAVDANRDCPWGYLALYDIPIGTMEYCSSRLRA
jgi:hypothetical protein